MERGRGGDGGRGHGRRRNWGPPWSPLRTEPGALGRGRRALGPGCPPRRSGKSCSGGPSLRSVGQGGTTTPRGGPSRSSRKPPASPRYALWAPLEGEQGRGSETKRQQQRSGRGLRLPSARAPARPRALLFPRPPAGALCGLRPQPLRRRRRPPHRSPPRLRRRRRRPGHRDAMTTSALQVPPLPPPGPRAPLPARGLPSRPATGPPGLRLRGGRGLYLLSSRGGRELLREAAGLSETPPGGAAPPQLRPPGLAAAGPVRPPPSLPSGRDPRRSRSGLFPLPPPQWFPRGLPGKSGGCRGGMGAAEKPSKAVSGAELRGAAGEEKGARPAPLPRPPPAPAALLSAAIFPEGH